MDPYIHSLCSRSALYNLPTYFYDLITAGRWVVGWSGCVTKNSVSRARLAFAQHKTTPSKGKVHYIPVIVPSDIVPNRT